jgi:hypothetical protein
MVPNFKLSRFFSFYEMVDTGHILLRQQNWEEAVEFVCNMTHFAQDILDPARDLLGRPLLVSSGFRCPALNADTNGAKNSQHIRGLAADVDRPEWDWAAVLEKAAMLAMMYKSKGIGAKVIAENIGGKVWIHIGRFDRACLLTGIDGEYVEKPI